MKVTILAIFISSLSYLTCFANSINQTVLNADVTNTAEVRKALWNAYAVAGLSCFNQSKQLIGDADEGIKDFIFNDSTLFKVIEGQYPALQGKQIFQEGGEMKLSTVNFTLDKKMRKILSVGFERVSLYEKEINIGTITSPKWEMQTVKGNYDIKGSCHRYN